MRHPAFRTPSSWRQHGLLEWQYPRSATARKRGGAGKARPADLYPPGAAGDLSISLPKRQEKGTAMRAQFKDMLAVTSGAARHYGVAVASVALALLLRQLIAPFIGEAGPHVLALTAVAISAWYGGRVPGDVATILAAIAAAYLVLPPAGSLALATESGQLQLGIFLVEGLFLSKLIGTLRERLRTSEAALRARDGLLAVAAHELKTPLTTVIGYTQTLQIRAAREGQLSRRDQDTLRMIAAQAKRLHTLLDSVLDLARLHNGQTPIARQVLDLAALARRVVADAHLTAPRHLVEFHGSDEPVVIVGDSVRLEQVLRNLLDNAVKYSPADGVITVCVEQRNAEAALTISDQGIGIPEEARAQLFERFYRASNLDPRRMQGAGIGLSIVSEIVALHGGMVEVDSAEGHGSTFTVRLPLPQVHSTAQSKAIDRRRSVSPALPTQQLERSAAERYHEHVH
jgi:signal transduction histidine kinase